MPCIDKCYEYDVNGQEGTHNEIMIESFAASIIRF